MLGFESICGNGGALNDAVIPSIADDRVELRIDKDHSNSTGASAMLLETLKALAWFILSPDLFRNETDGKSDKKT
jgi:hypothetical protein